MSDDARATVMRDAASRKLSLFWRRLPERVRPMDLFNHFSGTEGLFFLDSASRSTDLGRYSFIGFKPFSTVCFRGGIARIEKQSKTYNFAVDPFDLLSAGATRYCLAGPGDDAVAKLPFLGGGVGYLSYDLGRYAETLPDATFDDLTLPEMHFGLYDRIVAFDHQADKAWVITSDAGKHPDPDRLAAELADEIAAIEPGAAPPGERPDAVAESNTSREQYMQMVKTAVEAIAAGELFQVNLSQRFDLPIHETATEIYARLRQVSPGDFAAYLDTGRVQIISSSPERFLRRSGSQVETRPVKGTRARRAGDDDEAVREELLASSKDNAELAMIVDLARNDLGRVCEFGSVRVTEPKRIDSYATVHHLSAVVRGELKPGCLTGDLIRATFPGGSITGAPKIRAMEVIEELEPVRRGLYTGAIGYMDWSGNLDMNVAIRTLLVKDRHGYFSAGGGIVYDSDPEAEYNESMAKAKGIMTALGIRQE